ncbi:uncharacterized protein [Triticum aestivum]|uniref:uncharacterized protein n=1 Tax=Triticum aestivum TaxID=4565 RepID=UPI001D01D291|nr:uncharacterized protein LOC123157447 [Triticum aestivum]
MQMHVTLGGVSLLALIDSGSTHNFIAEEAAARATLPSPTTEKMRVTVANGERVPCQGAYRAVSFRIDQEAFSEDFLALPLAGYDVILGTQWLATLGPILWDFRALSMTFWRRGHRVCWRGLAGPDGPALQSCNGRDFLDAILTEFDGIFAQPSGVPPLRSCDHGITLLPGSAPVAVRPYRYPAAHKDELERQCAAMLAQGIIRASRSAFSSPVLLVRKPDGSWRFCIDYRALNAITIKDAFPIPVVDELLDELRHARFFTKLDLRSGYHQVRMRAENIPKTAFRTHDGLYEFLVMSFGLCNAPATFQALMNDLLRPYLRHFILVFFDDILIFSESWADHLRHVRTIFTVLRQHRLFVKRSKCSFAVESISYLGHTISAAGVAMDPEKVQAVADWPQPRSARAVRGFLGLAGYYRKFVKEFGVVAAPLTALLRKDGFSWSPEAATAFTALKTAVTTAPVLALPDFTRPGDTRGLRWLPWAEYIYNTAYQTSTQETPFKLVYGRDPPTIRSYEPGDTRVAAVARSMAERDELLADVRYRLQQAQAVYKSYYDRRHRDIRHDVGDWVWLRLRQRAASSPNLPTGGKLKPRFYGSYRISEVVNDVAYRLELPARSRLHDVFHVGLLKKFFGTPPTAPPGLPPIHNGAAVPEPERVTRARLARGVRQLLVHWKGEAASSATWEDLHSFVERYPAFQLEDELLVEGGERCHVGRCGQARVARPGAAADGHSWRGMIGTRSPDPTLVPRVQE